MGNLGMVERALAQHRERRRRRGGGETVEQRGDCVAPRCQRGAEDGGELAAAKRHRRVQRVGDMLPMTLKPCIDRVALAGEAMIVDAGAAPGPALAAAAEQARGESRCRRGVADSHLAETNEIGLRRHRVEADPDRFGELRLAHGFCLGEVRRGLIELDGHDAECRAQEAAELIDGGASTLEIGDHLRRDRGRVGGDAAGHHAVIAGEDDHLDGIKPRARPALPAPEPSHKLFEASEAALRLGEVGLAMDDSGGRLLIALRQIGE